MEKPARKLDLDFAAVRFSSPCAGEEHARAAEREFIRAVGGEPAHCRNRNAGIGLPVIERQSRGIAVTPRRRDGAALCAQMIIAPTSKR